MSDNAFLNSQKHLLIVTNILKTVTDTLVNARSQRKQDKERTEISEQDKRVSPAVVEADIKRSVVFITDAVLAVFAIGGCVWIVQITTVGMDEISSPLLARLT